MSKKRKDLTMEELIVEISEEICDRQKEILDVINQESVDVYLWLKNEYKAENSNKPVYKFVFRSFYRLDNAGLSLEQKNKFFELLGGEENSLKVILEELYKLPKLPKKGEQIGKNSIQFSFATKLIHTIDERRPIFDSQVSVVIHKNVATGSVDKKINLCEGIYNFLEELYPKLIKEEKINKVIEKFKQKFKPDDISNEKILDFLIWGFGKLKNKKTKL